ncbi:MAG: DUF494 family protein [Candidatus Latescibacterota bacterium]|nr:MAG: DUF494 family protein [Candidatus Latescibacterota bacterium]
MVSRLMDLLVLVAELSQNSGKSFRELDEELVHLGYSAEEIEQAFVWISSQWHLPEETGGRSPVKMSHRVLSPWESMCIDADSYGYLLRLQNLGIIDVEQFEKIITRILPVGGEKIALGEFKTLVGSVLFNLQPDEPDDELLDEFGETNQLT